MRKLGIGKLYRPTRLYISHWYGSQGEDDNLILREGIFFYMGQRQFLLTIPSKEISKIVKFPKYAAPLKRPEQYFKRITKTG